MSELAWLPTPCPSLTLKVWSGGGDVAMAVEDRVGLGGDERGVGVEGRGIWDEGCKYWPVEW